MVPRAASRSVCLLLLLVLVSLSVVPMVACSSKSPTSTSGSCGSGDVYWDTSVKRCRDHSNGKFVNSSCCGH